ncbi:MAG: response regulator [Alphaproteobacteria bacterium]
MKKDNITILLLEDDEIDAELVRRSIKSQGLKNPLVHAENGEIGLHCLRGTNGYEKITGSYIVMVDINMPVMNGLEFISAVREDPELKDAILFVLTTSDDDNDIAAAYAANVSGYFLKGDVGPHLVKCLDLYNSLVQFPPMAR